MARTIAELRQDAAGDKDVSPESVQVMSDGPMFALRPMQRGELWRYFEFSLAQDRYLYLGSTETLARGFSKAGV